MEIFIVWITTILSIAIGILIANIYREEKKLDMDGITSSAKKLVNKVKQKATSVGPVMRPSAERVILMHDKRREEDDEAFKESFLREHPEMKQEIERLKKQS